MTYEELPGLNWSTLKLLATSPRMLKHRAKVPRQDTSALALGRAIHCALLEPHDFESRYAVAPTFEGKGSRAMKATWLAERAPEVTWLDQDDYDLAQRCAGSIAEHPAAMSLIVGGRREETVQWTDATTGIKCKARLDNIRPSDLSDIKSTRHGTPRKFLSDASSLLYHGQLAWYHDGAIAAGVLPADAERPSVVAVQTTEPYDVMPFRMTEAALWAGRSLWQSLIRRFAECKAADFWPGVAPGILDYDVTPWADVGQEESEEF